jgi:hypothetical protein
LAVAEALTGLRSDQRRPAEPVAFTDRLTSRRSR